MLMCGRPYGDSASTQEQSLQKSAARPLAKISDVFLTSALCGVESAVRASALLSMLYTVSIQCVKCRYTLA
jgi:hypothetical protein